METGVTERLLLFLFREVGGGRIWGLVLNQDGKDERIDQELGINQDGKDERIDQELRINQDGKDVRIDQDLK